MLHGHWLSPEAGRVYGARKIQELADRILRAEENVYAGSKWPREYANRVLPRLLSRQRGEGVPGAIGILTLSKKTRFWLHS